MMLLIAAGVLALPSLLVFVAVVPVVAILSLPALALLIYRQPTSTSATTSVGKGSKDNDDSRSRCCCRRQVIVTGGSSGIGLAIAKECANEKKHPDIERIVLMARNVERLESAKEEILKIRPNMDVLCLSVTVADPLALEKAAQEVFKHPEKSKNDGDDDNDDGDNDDSVLTTQLFCCAGEAYANYYDQIPTEVFNKLVQLNQMGSIYTVQAFLPYMKKGTVTLTSSMAGQVGVFGFAAYSPTKYALRGYAECMHMELSNRPISIQVAYPPDTDTPGFAKENETKPPETHLVSEVAGLADPAVIGAQMVEKALCPNPPFAVYFSLEGWMVSSLTAGFAPTSTVVDAVSQVALMGLFRFISLFYLQDFYRMIRNHQQKLPASSGSSDGKQSPEIETSTAATSSSKE